MPRGGDIKQEDIWPRRWRASRCLSGRQQNHARGVAARRKAEYGARNDAKSSAFMVNSS